MTDTKLIVKKYALPKEELDRQVEEICSGFNMGELVTSTRILNHHNFELEQIVKGKIVDIKGDIVLVDFGGKIEAQLPYREQGQDNDDLDIGDETNFLVTGISENGLSLSRHNVELLMKQKEILENIHVGDEVSGQLIQKTKTGWIVNIGGLPAVLPGQSEYLVYDKNNVDELIDTEVKAQVESIEDMVVTLTRKPYANKIKKEVKASFFNSLNIGDVVEGYIKNITEFGAFIQVASGVIGLCHTSDFGSEEVVVGKKLNCKVLKLDREKTRVSLGIRQVTEPSWEDVVDKYKEEDRIKAIVKSIVPYGAFLEVEPGVSGLVHVSDLSWSDHVKHPKEVLSEGEEVDVMILGIDAEKQHLSLGLKQLTADPWESISDRYLMGSTYEGVVKNKTKFGIFVELESGVEGLAHHTVESKELETDQNVLVTILRVDAVRKKIALGFEE